MNIIPVTSANGGGVMLVNFDHVYCVQELESYHSCKGGTRAYLACRNNPVYELKETQREILNMLDYQEPKK